MAPMKSIMKKPVAAKTAVLKKPASATPPKPGNKGKGDGTLTEAAILALNGAPDAKVESFLLKLSDSEQNLLWKNFEALWALRRNL